MFREPLHVFACFCRVWTSLPQLGPEKWSGHSLYAGLVLLDSCVAHTYIYIYIVRRHRISWRLPYIVARLAGRESDFWGLSKISPGTVFCNMCFILLNASTK